MRTSSTDVVIIGGGIVGCATAYYLARQGAEVALLDRRGIGSGATGRSGGGVRQSARVSEEIPLARASIELFPTLSDELGLDIEYTRAGNLRLVEMVDHVRPMQVDILRQQELGLDVRWIGAEEVRELVPALRREAVFGASFCPTDGHCNPFHLVSGFGAAARRAGVKMLLGCEVRLIRQADSGYAIVEAGDSQIRARTVVIAAGAGSAALCRRLGFDLPLINMRYESLITEALPPLFAQMFGVASGDLFFRQTRHGGVHLGGGLIEEAEDEGTTVRNLQLAAEHIVRLVPQLDRMSLLRTWGGLDPNTPDAMPIIDRLNENVIVATGFSGHGLAIGPVVGRLLAEWIAGGDEAKPELLAPFRRNRFAGWLQTKWTPSGTFEAALVTESERTTQRGGSGGGLSGLSAAVLGDGQAGPNDAAGSRYLLINPDVCTGCRMCEMACSIHHEHLARPTQLRIKVAYASDAFYTPITCIHCEEAYCLESCGFDALERAGPGEIVKVIDENCIGCLLCVDACPYGGITFVEEKDTVVKCDLCGGDPACATYCATGAIIFAPLSEEAWERVKKNAVENVEWIGRGLQ